MSESWHKTETDLDAEKHVGDFWSRHHDDLQSGDFWADRIKQLRREPIKRLAVALENMPLPASFREAAIATRVLIRDKRKKKASYDEELALLYWLAAINSFSIPYSEVLKEPGYNVIESIPGKKLKGKRKQREQEFLNSIGMGANAKHALPEPSNTRKNSKSTKWVAVAVIFLALLLAVVLGG